MRNQKIFVLLAVLLSACAAQPTERRFPSSARVIPASPEREITAEYCMEVFAQAAILEQMATWSQEQRFALVQSARTMEESALAQEYPEFSPEHLHRLVQLVRGESEMPGH